MGTLEGPHMHRKLGYDDGKQFCLQIILHITVVSAIRPFGGRYKTGDEPIIQESCDSFPVSWIQTIALNSCNGLNGHSN
jgi:hypothetical protein